MAWSAWSRLHCNSCVAMPLRWCSGRTATRIHLFACQSYAQVGLVQSTVCEGPAAELAHQVLESWSKCHRGDILNFVLWTLMSSCSVLIGGRPDRRSRCFTYIHSLLSGRGVRGLARHNLRFVDCDHDKLKPVNFENNTVG